ncbi:recombinase family protein [Clostridium perfringens]|uniref:recombinase family protein n=1 Tax=Clostridium perfringens TaxID=1502 RepID=UPI001CCFE9F2|nr:recombinase family protein [Clostridium perfringens]MDK0938283.1 recombinase family protein [Clostridium perfringens]MDM0961257.1 recombinase family protein [Clostridium perfringens]MDM0972706.1 recombinase family protein [Clostridium perfringens]MDU2435048.1 recombinase family protein [Clostridium perfringens]MDU2516080.1 recombinase family protein [Clostridium perfringens]
MKTAGIYARKSKTTEKGDSIDNQIKLCQNYLTNIGIESFKIYKDDGFSGKNTDRPAFRKLMDDCKNGSLDCIICYKLDRISRNVSDFSSLISTLEKKNIYFISVIEQFDTGSAMGKAMMYICSVFSQLERETISQRVTDNMYYLAESGYWLGGEPPTGFTNLRKTFIDKTGKEKTYSILTPKDKEIELVKLIFDKYLELESLSQLEKYMLSNNIKTKRNKDWAKATLSTVLKNPCYVKATSETIEYFEEQGINCFGVPDDLHGILIYRKNKGKDGQKHPITDWIYTISEHEGIIDSPTWLKVQRLLKANAKKAPARGCSHTALLSGLVYCAICGKPMRVAYGQKISGSTRKRFYYMCTMKHNSGGTRCNNKNINGIELDDMVIAKLKESTIDKSLLIDKIEEYKKSLAPSNISSKLADINKIITSNNIMIENLTNNVSLTTDTEILTLLFNKIKTLKKENQKLTLTHKKILSSPNNTLSLITSCDKLVNILLRFYNVVDNLSFSEKKQLINSSISKILVNGSTGDIIINLKNNNL